jgi:hypothetical protein
MENYFDPVIISAKQSNPTERPMRTFYYCVMALLISWPLLKADEARSQTTEEQFHDLFVTAGYCTAFGAALGTAFMGLEDEPGNHLRYVYVGASLGFIGGSILGSYIIFAPALVDTAKPVVPLAEMGRHRVLVQPVFAKSDLALVGMATGVTLLSF